MGLGTDYEYQGGLFHFESAFELPQITIEQNTVYENVMYGDDSSLIYANGGQFRVLDNTFQYNGYLSSDQLSGNPTTDNISSNWLPFIPYSFLKAQRHGVFHLAVE